MLGDIEMQHLPTTMFEHDKHEQYFHRDRRHSEKVYGYRLTEMVAKKGLPGLTRGPVEGSDDS